MSILYDTTLKLYYIGVTLASLFNQKARLWLEGRISLIDKIKAEVRDPNEQRIWIHCASLGEFEQARPLIEAIKDRYPDYKIVLTFFSPSGYEVRKNYDQADYIFYLPWDTRKNASKFLDLVNPEMIFFIKYEFWHHYISEAGARKIPLYLLSGVFRKDHRFFKWYGGFFRKLLPNFEHFFLQDEDSRKLLSGIGIKNSTVSGDTRFDRVFENCRNTQKIPLVESFSANKFTLIAGSTWPADEKILVPFINNSPDTWRFIIAPHNIQKDLIKKLEATFTKETILYSNANEESIISAKVLIIDNIGMLSSLYQYGRIAYVGGGFRGALHNILEPATFGMPILFGPEYHKFWEAKELIKKGGAFSVSNTHELSGRLKNLIEDQGNLESSCRLSKRFIEENRGATDIIMQHISSKFTTVNLENKL